MTVVCEPGRRRFFELSEVPDLFGPVRTELRVLLLADDRHPAIAVQDHIRAFTDCSGHRITIVNTRQVTSPQAHIGAEFDAILIHYSIYTIAETYLSQAWQKFVSAFRGVVAVIHEDEYQKINAFKLKFDELGVQAVFSCLDSTETLERVYGGEGLLGDTYFFSCLPGYVAPGFQATQAPPIRGRPLDLVYRGRTLPPELGRFAQEKRLIGEQMRPIAQAGGLNCDISSAEEDRIYGPQWPQFLMSGKAMLGVEGGASIFDFDGDIGAAVTRYRQAHPDASFDATWSAVLEPHEGNIQFRTITPKFFEAIAAKTVLVLYPGRYSGVLEPGRHYLVLERDGSNASKVIAQLKDDDYLQALADRAWQEILCKPELASSFYVEQIDRVLATLVRRNPDLRRRDGNASAAAVADTLRQQLAATIGDLAQSREALSIVSADLGQVQQDLAQARQVVALSSEMLSASRVETALQSELVARLRAQTSSAGSLFRLLLRAILRKG